jgi:hypothetical protein
MFQIAVEIHGPFQSQLDCGSTIKTSRLIWQKRGWKPRVPGTARTLVGGVYRDSFED